MSDREDRRDPRQNGRSSVVPGRASSPARASALPGRPSIRVRAVPARDPRRPSIPAPSPPPASRRRDPREFNGSLDPPTVARLDHDARAYHDDGADEPETNRILQEMFVAPGAKDTDDETMTAVRAVDEDLLRASQMGLAVRPAMDSITELRAEGSAPRPIDRAARDAHRARGEPSYAPLEPSYSEPSGAAPFADREHQEPVTHAREPSQPSRGSSVISSLPKAAPTIAATGRAGVEMPAPRAARNARRDANEANARGPVLPWGAQTRHAPSDPEVEVGYVEVSNPGAYFSELADASDMNPTKALDLRAYQAPLGGRREGAAQRVDAPMVNVRSPPADVERPAPGPVVPHLTETVQPGPNRALGWHDDPRGSFAPPQPVVQHSTVHVPQPQRFQPPVFDAYAQQAAPYGGHVMQSAPIPPVAATMQQQIQAPPPKSDVKRLAWFVVGMAVGMAAMFVVFGHAQHRASSEPEPARVVETPSGLPPLVPATATAPQPTAYPTTLLPPLQPTSLVALPPLLPAVAMTSPPIPPEPPAVATTSAPPGPPQAAVARPASPPAAVAAKPPPARPASPPPAPPRRPAAASQSPANALQPDPEPSTPSTPTNTTPSPAATSAADLLQNAL